jgi:hypothetical protein
LARGKATENYIMAADAAECVEISIEAVIRGTLMLLIQHLLGGGKLDRKGTYPPYCIILGLKAAVFHGQRHEQALRTKI